MVKGEEIGTHSFSLPSILPLNPLGHFIDESCQHDTVHFYPFVHAFGAVG